MLTGLTAALGGTVAPARAQVDPARSGTAASDAARLPAPALARQSALARAHAPGRAPRIELVGPAVGVGFGEALAALDDVDGDGIPDLAVGAPAEPAGRAYGPGTVRVFSGADGRQLHLLRNAQRACACAFGAWIVAASDIDGDGAGDVLVGSSARGERACAGAVVAFSGRTGALLFRAPAAGFGARLRAGMARAGDVDGDGLDDVLVAGLRAAHPRAGPGAWILSGRDGRALVEIAPRDVAASASFGRALVALPDVDGDGVPDAALGDVGDAARAGLVHIVSGRDGTRIATFTGSARGDDFGASLAFVPDDATPGALLVGATQAFAPGGGYARLLGLDGSVRARVAAPGDRQLGRAVAAAADLDGDGAAELLVVSGSSACSVIGSVRVVSSRHGAVLDELCAPASWCDFGWAIAALEGGDGRHEVAVAGSGPIDHPTGAVLVFALDA